MKLPVNEIKKAEIKTIITDFDETLWKGVVAEKEKPVLNREYYLFLASLYRKGVVLFGFTKNDAKDVERVFKELGIDKNIFVKVIANWESKARNAELLVRQLELRSDTTFFIDDNPLELNEVKSKLPFIFVLPAKDWKTLKQNILIKKQISTNKSLLDRYKKYRHALALFESKAKFKGSDRKFLFSRKRAIIIGQPKTLFEFERVGELFYRTNRLNFFRRPLKSIREARQYLESLKEIGYQIFAVSVKDGGHRLGIQAAFSVILRGKKALVTNGTISCSVISFGDFEKKILNELFRQFFEKAEIIEVLIKETATNQRIREILKSFNFSVKKTRKSEYVFSLEKQNFKEQKVPWIKLEKSAKVDYTYTWGIPEIRNYFVKNEWKKIQPNSRLVVLGVGQGETFGTSVSSKLVKHLKKLNAKYFPIDIEDYGNNIVANAENLHKFFQAESVEYVICTELLEHTEHYWMVINEILRILKVGGRLFLSAPYNYPKHEYPIDRWRLSSNYLKKILGGCCAIERMRLEGDPKRPRRTILSAVKMRPFTKSIVQEKGKVDWESGLIYI